MSGPLSRCLVPASALTLLSLAAAPAQIAYTDLSHALELPYGRFRCVAAYDYDGDGRDDLLFGGEAGRLFLYRNRGDFDLVDVTEEALPELPATDHYGGAVFGDLDGDGLADLVLGGRPSPPRVLRQRPDHTFEDVTAESGVRASDRTLSLHLADIDGDGRLDIYIALLNARNKLFRNLGGLRFAEEAEARGAEDDNVSMGAIATDYDRDGDVDLYLTHDADRPNLLLDNDGTGHFRNLAVVRGVAVAANGMGVDVADVDADGMPDLYVTNLYENSLLLSGGRFPRWYRDEAVPRRAEERGMSWGVRVFDADHDGRLDIYVANETYFRVDGRDRDNVMYRGLPDGSYEDVAAGALLSPYNDFGMATADFDNDGDLDLAIATSGGDGCQVFRNDSRGGSAVVVRTGLHNAQATAYYGRGRAQWAETHGGSGFAGQSAGMWHFGIADAAQVDSLVVETTAGQREVFYDLAAGGEFRYDTLGGLRPVELASATAVGRTPDITFGPNPTEGSVTAVLPRSVSSPTAGSGQAGQASGRWFYDVRDLTGRTLLRGTAEAQLSLDFGPLPSGTYVIELKSWGGELVVVERVVKY